MDSRQRLSRAPAVEKLHIKCDKNYTVREGWPRQAKAKYTTVYTFTSLKHPLDAGLGRDSLFLRSPTMIYDRRLELHCSDLWIPTDAWWLRGAGYRQLHLFSAMLNDKFAELCRS